MHFLLEKLSQHWAILGLIGGTIADDELDLHLTITNMKNFCGAKWCD